MKRNSKVLPGRFMFDAMAILAVISLLLPPTASVLCIGPGGHMAIEEINAMCCASSGSSDHSENLQDYGFSEAGDCRDCTDLLLPPNRRGAVLESHNKAVPNSLTDHCLGNNIRADISVPLHRSATIEGGGAPSVFGAPVPLRC
jgi:hypothetical protein